MTKFLKKIWLLIIVFILVGCSSAKNNSWYLEPLEPIEPIEPYRPEQFFNDDYYLDMEVFINGF